MVQVRAFAACGSALAAMLAVAGSALAQIPDEFKNLQVLSDEIGKRELVGLMREFSEALGVRCNHCHAGGSADSLEGMDFASDEPEPKKVARAMWNMTREINERLLPATGRRSLTRVRCVTCHRGITEPQSLESLLSVVIEKEGLTAAIERYGELRAEYYGTAAYDFGPGTLTALAEGLTQKKDLDGALELMRLNLRHHPESPDVHLMLAQLYSAKGDRATALASVERVLALEPDNRWAKQLLEQLRAPE